MALLMSQTAFAERHGVGKSTVSNWKAAGLLVFAVDPDNPRKQLVDAEKSDLVVRGSIDPTRGRPRTADVSPDVHGGQQQDPPPRGEVRLTQLEQGRLEEMSERTRRRRIETEQLLGNLVPIAEYERRAGDRGRMVRERANALIRQHSERLAAETEPRQIVAILGEAFDALFSQVADEIEADAAQVVEVDALLAPLADDEAEELELEA